MAKLEDCRHMGSAAADLAASPGSERSADSGLFAPVASLLGDCGMIGASAALHALGELVVKLADSDATVLVTGESGTGKELVAHALHDRSRRASGRFVALNCAALPEALLESELFGHVKGAFTSASESRVGLFAAAAGGTLFLDEIAEVSPPLQAKLLRVLQERKVRPIGAADEIAVDVRLVAATNRDLAADVEAGRFRRDLYYRVDVVRIAVPPLRERGEDVLLLAEHFLAAHAARLGRRVPTLDADAAAVLLRHKWPGNVRELQNCVEHAVAVSTGDRIGVDDLPAHLRAASGPPPPEPAADDLAGAEAHDETLQRLSDVERQYIGHVLGVLGNNKTRAAAILGIDRRTLHRKLARSRRAARTPGNDPEAR
ncbi:MAG: sigma 54-interacting transcriptional regulator [Polyangiaceae bacterium]|nr:sigma 54-interacting transcriptional regulator [Polyangiaceae bacterium]